MPDLIAILENDPDIDARLQAVLVLDNLGPPARPGVAALAGRLRGDPDVGVRVNAAHALGAIKADPEVSVPALIEAYLTDEVGDVRNMALWGLGQFGPQARLAEPRAREAAKSPGSGFRGRPTPRRPVPGTARKEAEGRGRRPQNYAEGRRPQKAVMREGWSDSTRHSSLTPVSKR